MNSVVRRDKSEHAERRLRWEGRAQRCIVHCRLILSNDVERVRLKESKKMNLHRGIEGRFLYDLHPFQMEAVIIP